MVRSEVFHRHELLHSCGCRLLGLSLSELRLSVKYRNWAAAHAQTCQDHGGNGVSVEDTTGAHRTMAGTHKESKILLQLRASKNPKPQNVHIPLTDLIIPLNPKHRSLQSFQIYYCLVFTASHLSDADILAPRLIGTCIRQFTSNFLHIATSTVGTPTAMCISPIVKPSTENAPRYATT